MSASLSFGQKKQGACLAEGLQRSRLSFCGDLTFDFTMYRTDDPASFTSLQEQQQVYALLQQDQRQAQVQAQQNAVKQVREQRKALLGSPDPSAKQRQMQDSQSLLDASKDITQGLRRTKKLLSQVLSTQVFFGDETSLPSISELRWLRCTRLALAMHGNAT